MSTPYFDMNATTPVDPEVAAVVMHHLTEEFGNAGSRTHSYGSRAAKAVETARTEIESTLGLSNGRVVFTSGATESNNLAILGLREMAEQTGRKHIITSAIEHKAVLEPVERLMSYGFEVDFVAPESFGVVPAKAILEKVRSETLLVSLMHVNNETGMIQPILEVGEALKEHDTLFHVDAAQGFGKEIERLRLCRADLISLSAHKIYGPKGIGALCMNHENGKLLKLSPLMVGGGQEGGLRPGTLPVPLIAGFGKAAELARKHHAKRMEKNRSMLRAILKAAEAAGGTVNGDIEFNIGNVVNVSFPGIDSESAILMLQGEVAISNGAACSSSSYTYSHVLRAMGLEESRVQSALRISWNHDSPRVDWEHVFSTVGSLL